MFDAYPDLVSTHTLTLPTGEGITFDQTLWGKVIAIRMLRVEGGRFELGDDVMASAALRRLLEGATLGGEWAFLPEDARFRELRAEVRALVETLYGVSFDA